MIKSFLYVVILVAAVFSYLRYFEYRSLYFPDKGIEFTPKSFGMDYEEVYISTRDGVKINAWWIPLPDTERTLLFCHGNGGNIGDRLEKISNLRRFGFNVFIFDYRGYGKSEGRPSEKGLYADSEAAYDFLVSVKEINPEKIIIYGESLGGAVAIELAAGKNRGALITESTFTSSTDMARLLYPVFPAFIIYSKYDSLSKISEITIPKLIIHSKEDDIVPFGHSVRLFNAAKEPKTHVVISGRHNDCCIESKEEYLEGISSFLKSL